VGNSASGIDLAVQISPISQHPLLLSEKDLATRLALVDDTSSIERVPEISEFLTQDRSVRFTNGHVERLVDRVIFCTGYLYSFPFLRALDPPAVTATGSRAQNLYQQIFYIPRPTLSFVALPQRIVPFPVSECQAAIIARVLSGRLQLPPPREMRAWEDDMVAQRGGDKAFHVLGFPRDAEYINSLHAWSAQAVQRTDRMLGNGGRGKTPPWWGIEEQWVRQRIPLIKVAGRKLGAQRSEVKTLKELGFDFEEWKREGDGVGGPVLQERDAEP
jgi:cation diffusion facilitator CzcD-associated flavoprotein CzcO